MYLFPPLKVVKPKSIEIEITNESPVAGKQLKDIRLPGKALVGVILRENEAIVPRGNTQILDGDHIVLFTLPESVANCLNILLSKEGLCEFKSLCP